MNVRIPDFDAGFVTGALFAAIIFTIVSCTSAPPRPFTPGQGGGPGPQGCIDQKERVAKTGEVPGC